MAELNVDTMHRSVTLRRVMRAVQADDLTGFCTACGAERGSCEPDARQYPCESCGERAVYGAEELLFHLQA